MKIRVLMLALLVALPMLFFIDHRVAAQVPMPQQPPNGWTVDSLTPSFRWDTDGYSQFRLSRVDSTIPIVEMTFPKGQDTFTLTTPLDAGAAYKWRVRTNPYQPSQSIYTWSTWSLEFTFTTPGGKTWSDSAYIRLLSPTNGTLASTITPTLSWLPPAGATHFEMIITPAGNVAGSIRFVQNVTTQYAVPGPPAWYGMLPDTLYYWRVRVNNATGAVPEEHPSWGPWSDVWAFRTPIPSSAVLGPSSPTHEASVGTTTPTLVWGNPNEQVFYYEIQLSRDPNFTTDRRTSWTAVYWETVHGGLSNPKNSYQVSSKYPLERGATYYWRVRPAVPNASREVSWSYPWKFTVK